MKEVFKNLLHRPKNSKNPRAFTLLEMLIVMTGFFILLALLVQIYMRLVMLKHGVDARQTIIQNSYYMLEKINVELKDFTIDYEEYFNRSMVWCDTNDYSSWFTRNVNAWDANGHCDNFTSYGNENSNTAWTSSDHKLYYCSSLVWYSSTDEVVLQEPNMNNAIWCFVPSSFNTPYRQSFGQYEKHFLDVRDDVDFLVSAVWDNDDDELGIWPIAIQDSQNVQEIYLISQDKTERLFMRRKLISSWDRNTDGIISWDNELRYNIQILRLKWFDAGEKHDFDIANIGVYDGTLDTRACDYAQGFICHGAEVDPVLYSGYRLPTDSEDGWVDLFEKNLTLSQRNVVISPNTYGVYARADDMAQINPYFTLSITNKLYGEIRRNRLRTSSIENFQITLQTTFNTRNFYSK